MIATTFRLSGSRPWLVFTVAGFAAVAAYYLVPALDDALYLLLGFAAAAAIVVGHRVYRPQQHGWLLLAAGIALYCLGDLVYTIIVWTTATEPFPSIADGPYVVGQILVVFGVGRLAAPVARGIYRPALIDAALVTVAGVFVAWPLLLDQMALDQLDPLTAGVAFSYPLLDLVLIGVLVRHFLQPGRKPPSLILMILGVAVWLVADLVFASLSTTGGYVSGMWLDAGWLVAYVLVGGSALHPSMARLVVVEETHEATISNARLALIGLALVIPPLAFVLHGPPVHAIDLLVLALGPSAILFLGFFRLLGALRASRIILAQRRALEAELEHRARTDRLTGLANRAAITDRLSAAIDRGEHAGLVYLDLDDFKRVNDAFGHSSGEEVLREVAHRLRSIVADPNDVAHVGGDEFAIVVSPCVDQDEAIGVARQAIKALEPEVRLGRYGFRIRASVGIVWCGPGELTADDLLSRADIAMYQAKAQGNGGYAVFEPEMHDRAVFRSRLQNDLDDAVARGEIEPWFQPIFDVETLDLIGAEALARWRHPERGLVAPDDFIPIAELSGAIGKIDSHIIHVATAWASEWNDLLSTSFQLHVNITPREAADPATVEMVASALAESGLPAGCLVVEVTETALIDEAAVAPILARLKDHGVRLSIDDFGSRYAVLTQLGRLPIDIVKLDRSVLSGIGGQAGLQLFEGILRLAQSLGLETVAEGVESMDALPVLRRLGCDAVQGYALGRPMPAAEFGRFVLTFADSAA